MIYDRTADIATEPISTAEAKLWIKQDLSADDTIVDMVVSAAREFVEDYTGRSVAAQTWTAVMDGFPTDGRMLIPLVRPPVTGVTSIVYVATDGSNTTWSSADYRLVAGDAQALLGLADGASWPTDVADVHGAVTITYTAGYATLPNALKSAMSALVAHLYANRGDHETDIPPAILRALNPFAVPTVG